MLNGRISGIIHRQVVVLTLVRKGQNPPVTPQIMVVQENKGDIALEQEYFTETFSWGEDGTQGLLLQPLSTKMSYQTQTVFCR